MGNYRVKPVSKARHVTVALGVPKTGRQGSSGRTSIDSTIRFWGECQATCVHGPGEYLTTYPHMQDHMTVYFPREDLCLVEESRYSDVEIHCAVHASISRPPSVDLYQ